MQLKEPVAYILIQLILKTLLEFQEFCRRKGKEGLSYRYLEKKEKDYSAD